MKTIYLVRHGATDWNETGVIMGRQDIPLSDTGRDQAKKAGERLADVKFDACYCSPLARAKETAEIIQSANKAGFEIVIDERLQELYAGNMEGKTKDAWPIYGNDGSREADGDILMRARDFCNNVLELADDSSTILIVSHNGLMRNLRHAMLGLDGPVSFDSWGLMNCEIAEFKM